MLPAFRGGGIGVVHGAPRVVLVRSNPMDVANVIGLARATYRKLVENLAWAMGYNVVALNARRLRL